MPIGRTKAAPYRYSRDIRSRPRAQVLCVICSGVAAKQHTSAKAAGILLSGRAEFYEGSYLVASGGNREALLSGLFVAHQRSACRGGESPWDDDIQTLTAS